MVLLLASGPALDNLARDEPRAPIVPGSCCGSSNWWT